MARTQEGGPRDRRIRDNEAIDSSRERHCDNLLEISCSKVRRNLDEERTVRMELIARLDDIRDEIVERRSTLEVAQTRRIRRRHVERNIVRERSESPDAEYI